MGQAKTNIEEAMARLRSGYLASLRRAAGDLADVRSNLASNPRSPADLRRFRIIAHKLSGSAGTYGFTDLGDEAAKAQGIADAIILDGADLSAIDAITNLQAAITATLSSAEYPPIADDAPSDVPEEPSAEAKPRSRILIADDDPQIGIAIRAGLDEDIETIYVHDGADVAPTASGSPFDLIILDDNLPSKSGVEIVRELRASPSLQHTPILMLTANATAENVLSAIRNGATDYFTKPFDPLGFAEHIEQMLSRTRMKVLIVDDDETVRDLLAFEFHAQGLQTIEAGNGSDAIRILDEERIDLIILDRMMPGVDGGAVLSEARKREATRDVPIIILTAKNAKSDALFWLKQGASDFIMKPFDPDEVVLRSFRALGLADESNP